MAVVFTLLALVIMWFGSHILVKPDDTVVDAVNYTLKTPGTYHVASEVTNGSLVVADNGFSWSGAIGGVDVDAILTGEMLYIKSPAPDRLYSMVTGSNNPVEQAIQTLTDKLRNRWIKSDLQKSQLGTQITNTLKCAYEQKNILQQNDSAREEWLHAFRDTSFWVIRKGPDNGSTTMYQLLMDTTARASLFAKVRQTAYYRLLTSCQSGIDMSRIAEGHWLNATVTLSQPEHIMQSIVVDLGTSGTMTITPNYQITGSVSPPSDAASIDELLIEYLKSLIHIK